MTFLTLRTIFDILTAVVAGQSGRMVEGWVSFKYGYRMADSQSLPVRSRRATVVISDAFASGVIGKFR